MCPKQGLESCQKHIQAQKKGDKATFYSPAEEWVLPAASTIEPGEREFVVDSGATMHMVSKKNLNRAELETMRMSRNLSTVMTANGEVQTSEEATVYVKQLDLFVKVMLLEETRAVLFPGELCEEHGHTYHWKKAVKHHISPKMARQLIAIHQTMYHSLSLVYRRVPPQRPHLLLHHLHHSIPYFTSGDIPKIQYRKKWEYQ